jgi:hypothetical protein
MIKDRKRSLIIYKQDEINTSLQNPCKRRFQIAKSHRCLTKPAFFFSNINRRTYLSLSTALLLIQFLMVWNLQKIALA